MFSHRASSVLQVVFVSFQYLIDHLKQLSEKIKKKRSKLEH